MTDLLYPRLPPAVGRKLFQEFRVLPWDALRERTGTRHQDAIFAPLGGVEVSEDHLAALADAIRKAAAAAGYPSARGSERDREQFDIGVAKVLHGDMGIVAAEAASVDVWAFVGAVLLPDICFWRFPDPPEDRVIGPDLTRHTFARQWWRAYQLADLRPGDGLAALSAISESEMNQLFERRAIGGNRRLVRAVAKTLTDDRWADARGRPFIRDATSRIRRLLAFSMLEALRDDDLERAIDDVFQASADALAGSAERPSQVEESLPEVEDVRTATPTDAISPAATTFDEVLLGEIPRQLAELVHDRGGIADDQLVHAYEHRYGIAVPEKERDLVRRFAWSAKGRRFLQLDEENELWLPGPQSPATIEQLDGWTIERIRERARQLIKSCGPREDPFELLVHEVYSANGGRIPRLVMSLVGRIINEVRREHR